MRFPPPEPVTVSETYDILPKVLLRVSDHGAMAWRENSGLFWAPMGNGEWRRVRAGTPGCGDILGLVPLSVEHLLSLGILTIGAFLSVETKTLAGTARESQLEFHAGVRAHHGLSFIARGPEGVDQNLEKLLRRNPAVIK